MSAELASAMLIRPCGMLFNFSSRSQFGWLKIRSRSFDLDLDDWPNPEKKSKISGQSSTASISSITKKVSCESRRVNLKACLISKMLRAFFRVPEKQSIMYGGRSTSSSTSCRSRISKACLDVRFSDCDWGKKAIRRGLSFNLDDECSRC